MPSDIALLNAAGELARHATQRHNVIARNIANADSPDYKAKDIKPFSLDAASTNFQLRTSKSGHVGAVGQAKGTSYAEYTLTDVPAEPNGNSVSIEDQMMRSVQAQGQHNKALAIYQKSMDLLKLSVGRR